MAGEIRGTSYIPTILWEGIEYGYVSFLVRGGTFRWDIGTAGSTAMMALSIIPLCQMGGVDGTSHLVFGSLEFLEEPNRF